MRVRNCFCWEYRRNAPSRKKAIMRGNLIFFMGIHLTRKDLHFAEGPGKASPRHGATKRFQVSGKTKNISYYDIATDLVGLLLAGAINSCVIRGTFSFN